MNILKRVSRDFSKAARTYDTNAILQRNVADKLFAMCNYQNSSGAILDIGCGTGYFHELLRKNKIYAPLVQTDISEGMCEIAASYASPPEYGITHTCITDMHELPFADGVFAHIFSSMTMQWASDLTKVFTETRRVLSENGSFALSIVGAGSLFELNEIFLSSGLKPPIHTFYNISKIEENLRLAGFREFNISREKITMYYEDIYALFRSIKGVGASYKLGSKGLKGKNYFAPIEKLYREKFADNNGLPVTWDIVYISSVRHPNQDSL